MLLDETNDEEADKLEPTICLTCPCMQMHVNGRVVCVAAGAYSIHRQTHLVNINAWPKAASLVDARVIHRGDRILRIEAPHYRPGLPAIVWTRAADAIVRAQKRRHEGAVKSQNGRYMAKCRLRYSQRRAPRARDS